MGGGPGGGWVITLRTGADDAGVEVVVVEVATTVRREDWPRCRKVGVEQSRIEPKDLLVGRKK